MFVTMLCDICGPVWQVDFTPKCRSQLMKQQKRRLGDWRLDFNLRTSCEADVEKHCRVRRTPLTLTAADAALHVRFCLGCSLTDTGAAS